MRADFFIESLSGDTLQILPRDDGELSVVDAASSDRLPALLAEVDLQNSFLAAFAGQIATYSEVDVALLLLEKNALEQEFDRVYDHLRKVHQADSRQVFGSSSHPDVALWFALRGYLASAITDKNGYTDAGMDLLSLTNHVEQSRPAESSLVVPQPIASPSEGIIEMVQAVPELRDNPNVTHYMERYLLQRDEQGNPISVSDDSHIAVGSVDRHGVFYPHPVRLDWDGRVLPEHL